MIGGRWAAGQVSLSDDDKLRFYNPPPPYEHFHGSYDGLALWRKGFIPAELGLELPPDANSTWSRSKLLYQQDETNSFRTDNGDLLTAQRHHGGCMDWHSVDAIPAAGELDGDLEPGEAIPAALDYLGAPNSRWWQIERGEVDPSSYLPDSAHTPTTILTELIFSHSDDWFLFPVTARAGHVVTMETLKVTDAFGREYDSEQMAGGDERLWPGLQPPSGWSLFRTAGINPDESGLSDEALVLWHVAEIPLESGPIERVQFGLDEESNLFGQWNAWPIAARWHRVRWTTRRRAASEVQDRQTGWRWTGGPRIRLHSGPGGGDTLAPLRDR
jgi:hypothetical protein